MRGVAWLGVVFALLGAGVASGAPFEVVRSRESPEHARLVLAPRKEAHTATLVVLFQVGRYDEAGQRGLTRLAQHVMLEANRRGRYDDLVQELFGAGAQLELVTGLRQSAFLFTAHTRDFDRLAQRLLTLVLSPQVDAAKLELAAERTSQDPALTAPTDFLETRLAMALSADPRYGASPPTSASSAQSFTVQEVETYLTNTLAPCNAVVIAAGAFDADALRRTVARFRGGIPTPVTRLEPTLPVTAQLPAVSDVNVLAYPLQVTEPAQAAALRVVGPLLRQRMEQTFRRMGVGYANDASVQLMPWMDVLVLTLPAQDPSALDLGPFLLKEVAAVREGRISPEEFATSRDGALARLRLGDAQPAEVALALAGSVQTPAWYSAEVEAALAALTPQALARIVQPWLREDRRVHLLFSPRAPQPPTARPPSGSRRRR